MKIVKYQIKAKKVASLKYFFQKLEKKKNQKGFKKLKMGKKNTKV